MPMELLRLIALMVVSITAASTGAGFAALTLACGGMHQELLNARFERLPTSTLQIT
jgi:hypothetical protein